MVWGYRRECWYCCRRGRVAGYPFMIECSSLLALRINREWNPYLLAVWCNATFLHLEGRHDFLCEDHYEPRLTQSVSFGQRRRQGWGVTLLREGGFYDHNGGLFYPPFETSGKQLLWFYSTNLYTTCRISLWCWHLLLSVFTRHATTPVTVVAIIPAMFETKRV